MRSYNLLSTLKKIQQISTDAKQGDDSKTIYQIENLERLDFIDKLFLSSEESKALETAKQMKYNLQQQSINASKKFSCDCSQLLNDTVLTDESIKTSLIYTLIKLEGWVNSCNDKTQKKHCGKILDVFYELIAIRQDYNAMEKWFFKSDLEKLNEFLVDFHHAITHDSHLNMHHLALSVINIQSLSTRWVVWGTAVRVLDFVLNSLSLLQFSSPFYTFRDKNKVERSFKNINDSYNAISIPNDHAERLNQATSKLTSTTFCLFPKVREIVRSLTQSIDQSSVIPGM